MKKRILTIFALLIMIPTMIFATEVAITWEWMVDDPQVTGFRYQLNDENPDAWTVVDANTTMAVIQNLDGSEEYSLYLQQTFDGVNWSESSVSVAMPLFEAESEVVAPMEDMSVPEDAMATTDEVVAPMEYMSAPEDAMATTDTMATTDEVVDPMVEEVAPMEMSSENSKHSRRYYTSMGLNIGGIYNLNEIPMNAGSSTYSKLQPAINLALGFNNIIAPNKVLGFGLNLDVDLLGYVDSTVGFRSAAETFFTENTDFSFRVALTPEMEINTKHFVLDLGVIGDVTFVGNDSIFGLQADLAPSFDWFDYGVFSYGAKVGMAYKFNGGIQYVIDGSIRKVNDFDITDGDWTINGFTGLKFTY
jgi:hypothetical protein